MAYGNLVVGFILVQIFVVGVIVVWLRIALVASTEGAVNRLNDEISKANERQTELAKKIKEADDELNRRRAEAKSLTDKMRTDTEQQTKEEREKIITAARKESEEIIEKAQNSKSKLRIELEKEIDVKVIHVGMEIVNEVLSEKAKGALHNVLLDEFILKLRDTRMDRVNQDIDAVDIITVSPLDDGRKNELAGVIKEKMGKEPKFNYTTDDKIGGGVIIKFGSLALDGSIQNLIREMATELQENVEGRKN